MSYLTITDLNTHLYNESVETITRGDTVIAESAIDTAIQEAKGYLSRFDVAAIFATEGTARNNLLLTFIKDIAVYHLMSLANAGFDYEKRKERYERACAWLKMVMRGEITPDLPAAPIDTAPKPIITYGSNPKREQHF
jgi:phage gp36-like protein